MAYRGPETTPCCAWPIDPCCCSDWPDTWEEITTGRPDRELTASERRALSAQAIASSRLRALTAFRWGLCEDLLRPCGPTQCRQPVGCGPYGAGSYFNPVLRPYVADGRMYNCGCSCACDVGCALPLPGPVARVLAVTMDGCELDPADWWVDGEGRLIRTDGCWPHSQNFRATCAQEGSFCVRYLRGIDPAADPDAIRAVSALACALYRRMCDPSCEGALKGATRVSRDGVEWDLTPGAGDTGVPEADEWLDIVNPPGPNGQRRRQIARLYSPDLPRWTFRGVSEFDRIKDAPPIPRCCSPETTT